MPDDQSSYLAPVPEAIRRQSELADQIAREAGIANVPPPKTTTVVEQEPASPEPAPQAQEGAQPELPLESPQQAPAPAAPQEPDWQQRFTSLQGKYNAEVPELHAQVRQLERIVANIQNAPPREASREAPRPTPSPFAELEIDPADREAYGEELILKSQRWAEARLAPQLAQIRAEIAEFRGRTNQIAQQSAASTVEGQLDRMLPVWREVNDNPNFLGWLNQPDPFSGILRQRLITDAHVSGDAPRTLAFFQAWLREQTAVTPGPGTQMVQTTAPAQPVAVPIAERLPLESLAAPGRGFATPAAPGAPAPRIWTNATVNALYQQKIRGMWNGREAEFERLAHDIVVAPQEGRFQQ